MFGHPAGQLNWTGPIANSPEKQLIQLFYQTNVAIVVFRNDLAEVNLFLQILKIASQEDCKYELTQGLTFGTVDCRGGSDHANFSGMLSTFQKEWEAGTMAARRRVKGREIAP